MIRFKTFGTIDLRNSDGELRGILTQPKRVALLLRLASERPGTFLRRDSLLAMFWPELDTAGARNALRQALFHLRRELGEGVIRNRGDDEVGLDPSLIRSDASEFEEAAAAGRWRDALELVRGEIAPGLYVSDAAEFEEWLESRRAEVRQRAAAGAWVLCREAEAAGGLALAAGWARRALEYTPDDEAGLRRLMTVSIRAGDGAGAAQAFSAFGERMRREYGLAPSPETIAVRQTIPMNAAPGGAPSPGPEPPAPERLVERRAPASTPAPLLVSATSEPPPRTRRPGIQWVIVAVLVVVSAVLVGRWRAEATAHQNLNPGRLLIAPFRTAKSDSVLQALAVGLVDLTNARLSGASLPHPVDPDVALRVVASVRTGADSAPDAAQLLEAAERTGAGLVLTGTLLRQGDRLVLGPVLLETATGHATPLAPISAPIDSLPWMVDRMAASLLSSIAGEGAADAPGLASIPLPALRAYLDGRQAMREGRVTEAMVALARALELDSTFALAALDYAEAVDWVGEDPTAAAKQRAWSLRDRLGVRDRAILVAVVGRNFPVPSTIREAVEDWEAAIRWAPDRARAWFGLGDVLFHFGDMAGIAGAGERARNAFDHALALDSAAVPILFHRIELAAREGDTAVVRRLMPRVESGGASGDVREFLRWRAAVALGDSAGLRDIRARFDRMGAFALTRIGGWGQLDGTGMDDPARALGILQRMERTGSEAGHLVTQASALAGNRGQLDAMTTIVESYGMRDLPTSTLFYAGEDAGRPRFATLERAVEAGSDTSLAARDGVVFWKLWMGDPAPRTEVLRLIAEADGRPTELSQAATGCLAAARLRAPDAARRLHWADSVAGLAAGGESMGYSMLTLSRCHEAMGDRAGALDLLARRPLDPVYGPRALAGYLYHEGRLALLEGDRARALRAWRHFLALRDAPDPLLRPQVDAVRRAVDSLARL